MSHLSEGNGRTALVTGASAGIGVELATLFASHGFDVVLTARRAERLIALGEILKAEHGVRVRVMPADLARPETPENLVNALQRDGVVIDALVNNAGYAVGGRYRDTNWADERDVLQVLVTAPAELTHRLLPGMTARSYGRILNVASVAGLMPGSAGSSLYGGAKSLLIKFSQSLHSQQQGTGVHVTALCPGFTRTEFHQFSGRPRRIDGFRKYVWLDAGRVARDGYRAVMKNQPICIPSLQYRLISTAVRLLPLGAAQRLGEFRQRMLHGQTSKG